MVKQDKQHTKTKILQSKNSGKYKHKSGNGLKSVDLHDPKKNLEKNFMLTGVHLFPQDDILT